MIQFSRKYEPLLSKEKRDGVRYIVIYGGRDSGKSYAVSHFAHDISFEVNYNILYTRVTLTSAKISIIPEVQKAINQRESNDFFSVTENQIINKLTGSVINFKGLKTSAGVQTAQLKSITDLNIWILDEAEELHDESVFDDVDESIRRQGTENLIILILNTYRITKEHFIYKKFFERHGINDYYSGIKGNICYIYSNYFDNIKHIPKDFLKVINDLKESNYEKYVYRFLGKFRNKAEGVIFENWTVGEFPQNLPIIYGLDFGVTEPDACIKIAIDKRGKKIYCEEILYCTGLGTDELAERLDQKINKRSLMIADSANKRTILDLQKKGFNIRRAIKNQVVSDIKELLDYEFIITDDSINLKMELNNYAWLDKKGEYPCDEFNHLIDALRYAFNQTKRSVHAG